MATYNLDLGNLVVTDVSVVSGENRTEEELHDSAVKGAKRLLLEVLKQPVVRKRGKNESATSVVQLPVPVMRLPREKAPPKPKALTPWEKFALKKGIALNRKRDPKQWNEARQEWVDRYGKRRRETDEKFDWIREVKSDYVAQEEGGDPFLDERRTKKARLEKAGKNMERNQRRAAREKDEVSHLDQAARSLATASNGKFSKTAKK